MSREDELEIPPGGTSPPTARDKWSAVFFFAGPVAFALNLTAGYALSPVVAESGRETALHVLSLATFAVAVAAALLAWRSLRRDVAPDDAFAQRRRFVALGGVGLGALSALLIFGAELATLILAPGD